MTAARFLRLTSAAIRSRSTAAVDSRSSHSAIGKSVSLAKFLAKARVDCARGPSAQLGVVPLTHRLGFVTLGPRNMTVLREFYAFGLE